MTHGGAADVVWAGFVLLVYIALMVATTAARERARTVADQAAGSGDPARERAGRAAWERRTRGIRWTRVALTVAACVGIAAVLHRAPVAYPGLAVASTGGATITSPLTASTGSERSDVALA
ncbi:hypothetical protein [Cellulosimicrobium cellulans]|uniref:hypothetical protein n=1 Tax=Cellulosimicrobium cellulans TaxID=1710 RepID=UPI0008487F14|nr:hypothetical protein [Cellulosimicrobium cellulans]